MEKQRVLDSIRNPKENTSKFFSSQLGWHYMNSGQQILRDQKVILKSSC